MEEAKPKGKSDQLVQRLEPTASAAASFDVNNSKEQKSDMENVPSEENDGQSCSPSSTNVTGSMACSSSITLTKSSDADLKKAPDALKPTPPSASVDALNYVEGSSCKIESSRTGVVVHKPDSDVISYVKPACGSPTVISCNAPGTNEVQHQECEKGSTYGPVTGNVSCSSVDTDGKSDKLETSNQNHRHDAQGSESNFTFEVGKLTVSSVNETNDKGWKPFPSVEPVESFQTDIGDSGEGTPRQTNRKKMNEAGKEQGRGKRRSKSGSGTESMKTNKQKPPKESSARKLSSSIARNKKNAGNALSGLGKNMSSPAQEKDMQKSAVIEASPTLALFQQPFTDLQQLQLRAQIFVYGALVQGTAPDETCMLTAFGETERDVGRSTWGHVWRIAVERSHKQECLRAIPDFSPSVHLGVRVTEQVSRESFVQGKSPAFPAGRSASKSSPITLPNAAVSLPSPWNFSTSSHDVVQAGSILRASLVDSHPSFTPFHLYSLPQIRPLTAHPNSWPSQISSAVPWMLSPHTSAVHAGSQYANFSMSEIVQATPMREHPVVVPVNATSTVHPISSPLPAIVSSVASNVPAAVEKIALISGRQYSGEQKPRKRRKNLPSVDSQLLPVHQLQTDSGSPAKITKDASVTAFPIAPTTSPSPAKPSSSSVSTTSSIQVVSGHFSHADSAVASGDVPTEVNKIASTSGWQPSGEQKLRKRRKNVPAVDGQLLPVQQSQMESGSPVAITKLLHAIASSPASSLPMDSVTSASKFACSDPISPSFTVVLSSSVSASSSVQLVSSLSPSASPTNVPTEVSKTAATSCYQYTIEQKQRKRRKNVPSLDNRHLPVQQIQTESGIPAIVGEYTFATTCPGLRNTLSGLSPFVSEVVSGVSTSSSSMLAPSSNYQIISSGNMEKKVIFSKETGSWIEQAKLQAEDAAAFAASASMHREEVWSRLAQQRNSDLHIDIEGGLVSSAVAVAAAASVAKAAAAAAKVAFDAALQVKLMADKTLTMKDMDTGGFNTEIPETEGKKRSRKVTPAAVSKQKGKPGTSGSLIESASCTAENGVAASLAGTKRAHNLDAVVKVAELAAEAISQVTAVIAMGDPIPLTLNDLLEAGFEGYWTHQDGLRQYPIQPKNVEGGQHSNKRFGECNSLNPKESFKKDTVQRAQIPNIWEEPHGQSTENYRELVNVAHQDIDVVETARVRRRKRKAADFTKDSGSSLSSMVEAESASVLIQAEGPEKNVQGEPSEGNLIMQGSLVEVNPNMGSLRAVWLSAKVMEVKDGKALVCYNDLLSDEGNGQLKEWIPIETADAKPPRIRIGHPVKFEGKRKRCRASMGNHNWAVGDHVDAWIRRRWREGIITDKNKEDETKLTVQFPAGGDISTVRIWNIRPSLFWKDGQWVEWSREITGWINEDDAPHDKRQKLEEKLENYMQIGGEEKNLMKAGVSDASVEHPKMDSFVLPTKGKLFTVGWSTTENNNPAAAVKRTRLQKGGTKVVFGVPKPGWKTKFVDVSKHYMAEQVGKVGKTNDSKFGSHIMPQGSSAPEIASKGDPARDRVINTRSKDVKLGKPQVTRGKGRTKKDNLTVSVLPPSSGSIGCNPVLDPPYSVDHEVNPQRQNEEIGSFRDAPEGQNAALGVQGSDVISSRKESSSVVDSSQAPKVRITATGEEQLSSDEKGFTTGRNQRKLASEPRRSSRRTQPTSRLLEGLESSLTVTKVSSGVLHEKQ